VKRSMTVLEKINKYRIRRKQSRKVFDYVKALGEAEYNRIEKIVEKEVHNSCVRTHRKKDEDTY